MVTLVLLLVALVAWSFVHRRRKIKENARQEPLDHHHSPPLPPPEDRKELGETALRELPEPETKENELQGVGKYELHAPVGTEIHDMTMRTELP